MNKLFILLIGLTFTVSLSARYTTTNIYNWKTGETTTISDPGYGSSSAFNWQTGESWTITTN